MFEIANSGTFFLDEVCELTPNLQVKLLRVLQERQFRRIGGRRLIHVDIRVIAASNRNLEEQVARGNFREDLLYRLNTITLRIPPLRERTEDIPLLVHHFIKKFEPSCRKKIKGITPQALELLSRYPWPGNVRELSNVVERGLTLTQGPYLDVPDLPREMVFVTAHCSHDISTDSFAAAKREAIRIFESEYLSKVLSENSGNISRSARQANITRSSLQRLLRRHHLKSRRYLPQ
ncbi:MAG: sigma-54-dependent Fis family transcriptional regulator [Acidobacteria bacterium]|nr:sigma-54-dependent Fis family transcriptional regulator [Acidobacteriota bacterium]